MTRVLFIIPAKGTSRRIAPSKNLRPLAGVPLVVWTIRAALGVQGYESHVVVSTDSEEIAELALAEGAEVVMRPPELARDPAEAPDVALHVLQVHTWKSPDAVCMLLPTSPFRTAEHIADALELHIKHPARPNVLSARDADQFLHHKLCTVRGKIRNGPPLRDVELRIALWPTRSEQQVLLNGAIWVATPARLAADGHFSAIGAIPYLMDEESGLDIDTPLDFLVAESVVAYRERTP